MTNFRSEIVLLLFYTGSVIWVASRTNKNDPGSRPYTMILKYVRNQEKKKSRWVRCRGLFTSRVAKPHGIQ